MCCFDWPISTRPTHSRCYRSCRSATGPQTPRSSPAPSDRRPRTDAVPDGCVHREGALRDACGYTGGVRRPRCSRPSWSLAVDSAIFLRAVLGAQAQPEPADRPDGSAPPDLLGSGGSGVLLGDQVAVPAAARFSGGPSGRTLPGSVIETTVTGSDEVSGTRRVSSQG
jgi:hypothetical protein